MRRRSSRQKGSENRPLDWESAASGPCRAGDECNRGELTPFGGAVIDNLDALLQVEECKTPDELLDDLNTQVEGLAWIDWDESDDTTLALCVNQFGTSLTYPFNMGEFWLALVYLDGIAMDEDNEGEDEEEEEATSQRRHT